jgi:hypothetical protein
MSESAGRREWRSCRIPRRTSLDATVQADQERRAAQRDCVSPDRLRAEFVCVLLILAFALGRNRTGVAVGLVVSPLLLLTSGSLRGLTPGSSYLMTQSSLQLHLAKAQASNLALRQSLAAAGKGEGGARVTKEVEWDLNRREGGVGGQETMEDKYRSTSGDH